MSHCDVSLGDYYGDEAKCYTERAVMARKVHQCYECREDIGRGTQHQIVSGCWEGEWRSYRFCAACWEILHEFSDGGAVCFGVTWDTFHDEWSNGATLQGCLNRLSGVEVKHHMTRQWRKWKGLEGGGSNHDQ